MNQLTLVQDRPVVPPRAAAPVSDQVRRVIIAGLLVTLVLVVLQAVSQVIDFKVWNLQVRAFNSDKRDSVFGLASLLAQAAVAAACGVRAGLAERYRWSARLGSGDAAHRRAWLGLGVLLVALVIVRGLTTFNEKLLAAPLALVFLLLCWLTWRDSRRARGVVWAGLALMALSLLLHKFGLAADASTASDYTWGYQLTSMVKHGAELAGWMLLTIGIIAGSQGRSARE
jgi:hypothetical protein